MDDLEARIARLEEIVRCQKVLLESLARGIGVYTGQGGAREFDEILPQAAEAEIQLNKLMAN